MKCYMPEGQTDEGRCPNDARYEAWLDWTCGPMFLCEEHAMSERALLSVTSIATLGRRAIDADLEGTR